jgi:single-stranded-DNA-specific exonuclease
MAAVLKRKVAEPAAEMARPFLGVAQSARGLVWRERLAPEAHGLALAISQQHGLPELLGRVLAARGIALESVPRFLDPTLKAMLPDPSSLRDMDAAASRLADAVTRREKVAIFGDYDVDGASSSALLARFLAHHETPARIYIPDRLFEGYGPNPQAIDLLIEEGAKLIVTVDCGTMSFEPLAHAKKKNTDVIVIDHHQAEERLPEVTALVNPNRQDDLSGQGHLCAAGVVFLTLVATVRELRRRGAYGNGTAEPDLLKDLDIVALATVADVVPLTGLNRAYVVKGLQVMRQRRNVGLKALFDAAALAQAPTPYHLGFILGPRINAGGRIGDAGLGARLLSTEDEADAARIAGVLDRLNKERKAIETAMIEEAAAEAEGLLAAAPDLPIVVVGSERWHKGIVGLVASRLTERHRRPSCVIAWESDDKAASGTGSLRSIAGADIGAAVRGAVAEGILAKGGGHAMAAGLTVTRDKLPRLREFLAAALQKSVQAADSRAGLDIDGALTPAGATDTLLDLVGKAGPYGQGNPQPRFAFPSVRVKFAKVVGEAHVRCILEGGDGARLEAVAFRASGQPLGDLLLGAAGLPLHVAGNLKRDSWGGREKIELMIDDAADPRRQG